MYVDDIGFRLIPIMAKMRLRMAGWMAHSIMDICSRNVCI